MPMAKGQIRKSMASHIGEWSLAQKQFELRADGLKLEFHNRFAAILSAKERGGIVWDRLNCKEIYPC